MIAVVIQVTFKILFFIQLAIQTRTIEVLVITTWPSKKKKVAIYIARPVTTWYHS